MPNLDQNRTYDGFVALDGGMDAGYDPSLLSANQYAFGGNLSVRGGFPRTRPGYLLRKLTFDSSATQAGWNSGVFQGATAYTTSNAQQNSLLVAINGRLFRVWVSQNFLVTEITPRIAIQVSANFTVPSVSGSVTVDVTTETPFTNGQQIIIASGHYTITAIAADELTLTYNGSSAVAIVTAGTGLQDSSGNQIYAIISNLSGTDFLWLFQADNYGIIVSPGQSTVIFDGANTRLADQTQSELPSGWLGVFGWGRIWLAQVDERSFIASDLVGDPSGSPPQYLDAILKVTENILLNGGGTFTIPTNFGNITAMQVLAQQDTSLGIGPILIGTTGGVFSVQAPTDRTNWQNLTYPIQSVALHGFGPVGPRSAIMVNSDMWFRAPDGIRSFMASRRDFDSNQGNTPQSYEMEPVLSSDEPSLLIYGSAAVFDNRLYFTVSPYRTALGVAHRGLAVMNLDSISTLQGKDAAIWESLYTGLPILQAVPLNVNGDNRALVLAVNADNQIDLWELTAESDESFYDQSLVVAGNTSSLVYTPVSAWLELRAFNFNDPTVLKKLVTSELYLDELMDQVTIAVYFKPDQYPNWVLWTTYNICATVSQCTINPGSDCSVWMQNKTQYAARLMLPRPPETDNTITGQPVNLFYEMQFKFVITGHARIRKFKPHAKWQRMKMEGEEPPAATTCTTVTACPDNWFTYSSYGA